MGRACSRQLRVSPTSDAPRKSQRRHLPGGRSSMIGVENLTRYYGHKLALDRVTFQIDRGEAVGLLGLNGAGKSTMLRILTSLMLPSAVRATIDGLDVVQNA